MTIAAQEAYAQCEPQCTAAPKAPPTLRDLVQEARDHQASITDNHAAAQGCNEACQRFAQKVDLAIDSDLYNEFDVDGATMVRQLAASVAALYNLMKKQLDEVRNQARECEEAFAIYEAAKRLEDPDEQTKQEQRVLKQTTNIRETSRYNVVFYEEIQRVYHDTGTAFYNLVR